MQPYFDPTRRNILNKISPCACVKSDHRKIVVDSVGSCFFQCSVNMSRRSVENIMDLRDSAIDMSQQIVDNEVGQNFHKSKNFWLCSSRDGTVTSRRELSKGLKRNLKFPLAPMGDLAAGSAHARPSARPPSTRVCRVTFKHLPQFLKTHIRSVGTQGQLLECSKKQL